MKIKLMMKAKMILLKRSNNHKCKMKMFNEIHR